MSRRRRRRGYRDTIDRCGPTGKRRYRSEGAARHALTALAPIRPDPEHREQRAYPCNGCGGWHLTSQARHAMRGDVLGGMRAQPARKEA